jgi:hypothetical protein
VKIANFSYHSKHVCGIEAGVGQLAKWRWVWRFWQGSIGDNGCRLGTAGICTDRTSMGRSQRALDSKIEVQGHLLYIKVADWDTIRGCRGMAKGSSFRQPARTICTPFGLFFYLIAVVHLHPQFHVSSLRLPLTPRTASNIHHSRLHWAKH